MISVTHYAGIISRSLVTITVTSRYTRQGRKKASIDMHRRLGSYSHTQVCTLNSCQSKTRQIQQLGRLRRRSNLGRHREYIHLHVILGRHIC